MTTYRLEIHHKDYSSWRLIDETNNKPVEVGSINPIQDKLFDQDILDDKFVLSQRSVKLNKIPGILLLEGNKTYGRHKNRLLYKCIPHNKHLPVFLVPYELKIGFSKHFQNKYVLFSYDSWDTKHPYGLLDETIGDVNLLTNTSRYLLHCNDLVYSHKKIQKKIGKIDYDTTLMDIVEKHNVETLEHKNIFSIDPLGSKDLDDAMSIDQVSETKYIVRIYIANVLLWIDCLDLWEELTNQPSTIYLPNEKKSMLPNILGDQFCSLLEKQKKLVQVFEFCIENNNVNKAESKIYNALVTIKKNYVYDEEKLQSNKHYSLLEELTQNITSHYMDSHEVVSYWMVEANKWMADTLHNNEKGIYRTAHYSELPTDVSLEHKDVIQTYLHTHSQYMLYKHDGLTHSVMREDKYVHVTSPIRRMVDICNQYYFQLITNNEVSLKAFLFMNRIEDMIDDMNAILKKIKKVQNQMNLLSGVETHNIDLNKEFKGVIIDKDTGEEYNEYQVFIPELSLFQQVRSNEIKEIYDDVLVKMYYLQDEYITYKKIRCQMI
tara:strand:- start:4722 stop:6362 length:1641 start_codon:yes stop_codon:yes gene_type:complete